MSVCVSVLPARREAAQIWSLFSGIFTDNCRAGVTISNVSCTHTHTHTQRERNIDMQILTHKHLVVAEGHEDLSQ